MDEQRSYNNGNPNIKPHALCFPFPSQSHIKAMLKLSKLLHNKGFHITFVNTEFNQNRFLRTTSLDPASVRALGFRFETIPDGLNNLDSDPDATQDIVTLCHSTRTNFTGPLLDLVAKINDRARSASDDSTAVSCVVLDGFMSLAVGPETLKALGIPVVKFFPISANAMVGLQQFGPLLEKGIIPIKDESTLTNGNIDNMAVDWIHEMRGLRMRDLTSFWRITNLNDIMFNYCKDIAETAHQASAVIFQTFDALEQNVLDSLKEKIPNVYTIGPLQPLLNNRLEDPLNAIPYNLWKEEIECLKWLDNHKPNSVIYVNFGSITVLTPQQVVDIGWGLANSNHPFLWVIRPDLVISESGCLSQELLEEIKGRSVIISWCPQEDVLNHPSVGGFLSHCGWNSVIESISSGVPLLCYPFFADQQTNSWLVCSELGVGLEIERDVKRDQVEEVVRDLLEGEKGKKLKTKAMGLKKLAQEATMSDEGSSSKNIDKLVDQVLLQKIDGKP